MVKHIKPWLEIGIDPLYRRVYKWRRQISPPIVPAYKNSSETCDVVYCLVSPVLGNWHFPCFIAYCIVETSYSNVDTYTSLLVDVQKTYDECFSFAFVYAGPQHTTKNSYKSFLPKFNGNSNNLVCAAEPSRQSQMISILLSPTLYNLPL